MLSNPPIEQELLAGLKRIDVPYREALSILEQAEQRQAEGRLTAGDYVLLANQLKPSMSLIADCESQLHPLRERWNESDRTAGAQLQQMLSNQTDLLKRLIDRLAKVEAQMVERRSDLGLALDDSLTHVAMRQAYHKQPATNSTITIQRQT